MEMNMVDVIMLLAENPEAISELVVELDNAMNDWDWTFNTVSLLIESIVKQARKPEEMARLEKITRRLKTIVAELKGYNQTVFCGLSIEDRYHEKVCGSLLTINDKMYIYPQTYGDLDDIDFGYSFVEIDKMTLHEVAQ
ncbi:hypothetical protein GF373_17860 [bacterium]|nr:hypothetical protein [bacterium]